MNKVVEMLGKAESWLDSKGRPAWIAAMVIGFVFVWPVGLAILFYMLWSGRMGCKKGGWGRNHRKSARDNGANDTGNSAFDEYREETLRRLEDERAAFVDFLEKLRKARDKAEFDQFMADRTRKDDGDQAPVTA